MQLTWHRLEGVNAQAPVNSVQSVRVHGKKLCLVKLVEGFFALDDKCPHAGGSLSYGTCDAEGFVVCPMHRYRFDAKTGKGKQGDYVNTYPVEVREDGMYLALAKRWWSF